MAEVEFDPGTLRSEIVRQLADDLSGQDGLAMQAIEKSHARLSEFADDYDVQPVIDSLEVPRSGPAFRPDEQSIDLRWEWTHPAADFFNTGTSDHRIDGDPILSFIWSDAPAGVRAMFPDTERVNGDPRVFFRNVEVTGIKETRFVDRGVEWLQQELARRYSDV